MRREIEIVRLQQIQEQLRQIRHLNRQQMQLLRNFHHDVMAHLRRWRVLFGLLGALLAFVIYIGLQLVLTQLTPDQSMVHIILTTDTRPINGTYYSRVCHGHYFWFLHGRCFGQ